MKRQPVANPPEATGKMARGFFWTGLEFIGRQGVTFVIQILLARLLVPDDFGLVGMLTIFIALANVLIESGFQTWLLHEKAPSETDFSTVFFFNFSIALVLYGILFFIAPFVADFYQEPILTKMLRLLGLLIVFAAFSIVQRAQLTIKFDFRSQAIISTVAMALSGAFAIAGALAGLDVWSLVLQQVLNQLLQTILLTATNRWFPRLVFDISAFKKMFSYSWKLLVSSLLDTVYQNGISVLVGKFFLGTTLGYYTNAQKMRDVAAMSVTNAVNKVSFPSLSRVKEDQEKLRKGFKEILSLSMFLTIPLMLGLAGCAYEVFEVLFGPKWLPAVPYFQIMCLSGVTYPLHMLNLVLLQIVGRTDSFLLLEIVKKILGFATLVSALLLFKNVFILICVTSGVDFLMIFINGFYTKGILDYSLKSQFRQIGKSALAGGIMLVAIFGLNFLPVQWPAIVMLLSKVLVGSGVYLSCTYFFGVTEIKKIFFWVQDLKRQKV